jgi:hypothetical protein
MNSMIQGLLVSACVSLACTAANAATTDVFVSGANGPWLQSLNPSFGYGVGDNASPTAVSAGYDFTAGGTFTITYLSGTESAGSGFPITDAIGDTGFLVNNGTGSSGTVLPSFYVNSASYPAYLSELVGVFADNGVIVGTPFLVGDGTSATAPSGADELLLGVNDDIFSDNTGGFNVSVSGPTADVTATPLPAALPLFAGGLGLLGMVSRRRKRMAVSIAAA